MVYWFIIAIGVLILSLSLSNPFYYLIFKKKLKISFFLHILIRITFFILGVLMIFIGLYLESIF
jgi:hypothetical protein